MTVNINKLERLSVARLGQFIWNQSIPVACAIKVLLFQFTTIMTVQSNGQYYKPKSQS
jgi:hypothetical protein